MKKSTLQTIVIIAAMLLMCLAGESCTGSRYGCPGQGSGLHFTGYR